MYFPPNEDTMPRNKKSRSVKVHWVIKRIQDQTENVKKAESSGQLVMLDALEDMIDDLIEAHGALALQSGKKTEGQTHAEDTAQKPGMLDTDPPRDARKLPN